MKLGTVLVIALVACSPPGTSSSRQLVTGDSGASDADADTSGPNDADATDGNTSDADAADAAPDGGSPTPPPMPYECDPSTIQTQVLVPAGTQLMLESESGPLGEAEVTDDITVEACPVPQIPAGDGGFTVPLVFGWLLNPSDFRVIVDTNDPYNGGFVNQRQPPTTPVCGLGATTTLAVAEDECDLFGNWVFEHWFALSFTNATPHPIAACVAGGWSWAGWVNCTTACWSIREKPGGARLTPIGFGCANNPITGAGECQCKDSSGTRVKLTPF
jgi:hypothetical protein